MQQVWNKPIDLTPPTKRELFEFKRLMGMNHILEDVPPDAEETEIDDEQLDPNEQLDPDDSKDRDAAENKIRRVVGYDGKEQWNGAKPGPKMTKKKIN